MRGSSKDLIFKFLFFSGILLLGGTFISACGPPPPPDPPPNVRTDVDRNIDGEIVILWDKHPEERVVKYKVYRATAPDGKFDDVVYEGSDTEFVDRNVIVNKKYEEPYYYRVTAIDKDGQEGKPSPVVKASTVNYKEPFPPGGLEVRGSNLGDQPVIEVSWDANSEADIDGYYVFRSEKNAPIPIGKKEDAVSPFIPHEKGTSRFSWEDTSVKEGRRYYYTVVAVDKGGLMSNNPPSSRKDDIVLAKVDLVAPQNNNYISKPITFKWKGVDNAVGYVLIIQTQQFGGTVKWRSPFITKTSTTYDGSNLTGNKNYYWFVFAYSKRPKDSKKEDGNSRSELWKFKLK